MARHIVDDHWRKTGNSVRFGPIDALALAPAPLLLVWKSWFLLIIVLCSIGFFYFIESKGYTFRVLVRRARLWVSGSRKMVRRYW